MDSPNEGVQVFHPSSVPIDQATRQRQEHNKSYRSCFYVSVVILALFGGAVIVGASYLATNLLKSFLSPTKQYALHHKHVQRFNASQVHPLIETSSTFDIQATVWQDVTDLLARGEQLPTRDSPWQLVQSVVHVKSSSGITLDQTRTEAIIYHGKLAQGASIHSKIHTTVPLRIPVAPLYTDNLGPSSLRATFSIAIPDDKQTEQYGSFRNVSYMYPSSSPFLPRRVDHAEHGPEHDLNSALAEAGISTSLLELVPTPWYRLGLDGNAPQRTIDNSTDVSPFFSAHRKNLRYIDSQAATTSETNPQQLSEFRDGHGTILLPHFRIRSRVGMVRATDAFDNATFLGQQRAALYYLKLTCSGFSKDGSNCLRPYNRHAFETLLTFAQNSKPNSQDAVDQDSLFYAPTLTHVSTPLSPVFQLRIPQRMPQIDRPEPEPFRGNASVACEIPPAQLDASKQFFEFDWQIYFSAHTLQRVVVAETPFTSTQRPDPAPLLPGEEGDKQLIANMMPDLHQTSSVERFASGDRLHPYDHPSRTVLASFAMVFWQIVVDELLLFCFWHTRKTSSGLWIEAQWLWVAVQLLTFTVPVLHPFIQKDSDEYSSFFELIWMALPLLHVPFLITTVLHLERPAGHGSAKWWRRNPLAFRRRRLTRRERKSIVLAETIDKKPFYILFASVFIICLFEDSNLLQFSSARQCIIDDRGGKASFPISVRIFEEGTRALGNSLATTCLLAQAWFNHRSSTFTGSFRIAAVGTAFFTCVIAIITSIDTFSGRIDKRLTIPVGVDMLIEVVPQVWFAYQAVTLKGVPQVERDDDDDQ